MEQKLKKEKELELKKKEKIEREEKEKAEKEAASAAKKEEEIENKTPQKDDRAASSKSSAHREKKSNKPPVLLDNKPKVNSLTRFLVSNPVVKTKDKASKDTTSNSGSSKAKAVEEITQFDELLSGGLSRDQIDRYNRERYRTGENPYKRKRPKKPLRKRKKLMVKIYKFF